MDKFRILLNSNYGIDEQMRKDRASLEKWAATHYFSSLHLNVILGDHAGVMQNLKNGDDPNAKDRRLWTPLHHAALLHDAKMMALLLENGADPSSLNDYKGTYQDVLRLTTFSKPSEELTPVFFKGQQLTQVEYEKLTHSHYLEEYLISPRLMLELWQRPFSSKKSFNESGWFQWVNQTYSHVPNTYQKVHQEILVLAPATDKPTCAGLGVFAKRHYLPFEPIDEYVGVIEQSKSNYAFSYEGTLSGGLNIEAKDYSNALSRVNDGFPNLGVVLLNNSRGLPVRVLLIALEAIPAGSQLCYDYGNHVVKTGPYVELRGMELREFIKKHGPEQLKESLDRTHPLRFDEFTLEDLVLIFKLQYLLHSPSVIFSLLLDGSIDSQKGKKFLDLAATLNSAQYQDKTFFDSLTKLASRWRKRAGILKEEDGEEMIRYIQSLTERVPFIDAVRLVESACELLDRHPWVPVREILDQMQKS